MDKKWQSLCTQALKVVKKASLYIHQNHGLVTKDKIEIKELNSLVSHVDKNAEDILVNGLSEILPEAGFLTEENTVEQSHEGVRWIIDPLDGTTNFLHGLPHYAVSVGLEIEGEVVIGIVEHIPHQEQYYAWAGGGAFMNNQKIHVNSNTLLADAMVATGFPYRPQNEGVISDLIVHWIKNARSIRRYGSAALDLVYVARGMFDFYYEGYLNAWDIAGGALIVKEAGGKVTDYFGEEGFLSKGNIIASNSALHTEVLQILTKNFKK